MRVLPLVALCLCVGVGLKAGAADLPSTTLINSARLLEVKTANDGGSREYVDAMNQLRRDAEKALAQRPVSVVEKKQVPPSGDKHDYMSLAVYWWPDPAVPDGKPYIRRDGEVNPESRDIPDHEYFGKMAQAIETLGLAHYFFGGEDYAGHAAQLVRVWFLDPATRMNPNMQYAQAVPGRDEGRGAGIIDLRNFPRLLDGLRLIETSPAWTNEDKRGMQEWTRQYISWLRESSNGKHESAAKNNHGTWYDVQLVSLALYVGEKDLAREVVSAARTKRIASQIRPDGSQPEELARTRSWGYSAMNLEAFFTLATLAERVDVDLWSYVAQDGRSIRKALEYLYPFLAGEEWKAKEIRKFDRTLLVDVLRQAAAVYKDERYAAVEQQLAGPEGKKRRAVIVYPSFVY